MPDSNSRIQELVDRPNESLAVELKRWFDPDSNSGKATIVKNAIALRNYGGGYLVIGFDDETHDPDTENIPDDVQAAFHTDKIQGFIARYSSEQFEISVEFTERDGQTYPVISVPPGVRTPVSAKSDLFDPDDPGRKLIKANAVYTRSLAANNTPSTTEARYNDWPQIVEVCFDNREEDIGRFLRRQLRGVTLDNLQKILHDLICEEPPPSAGEQLPPATEDVTLPPDKQQAPPPTAKKLLQEYIKDSRERYRQVVKDRNIELPKHGDKEVGLIINGEVPHFTANRDFLNLLDSANPNYTGWPAWLISRDFNKLESRPYVYDNQWEALIVSLGGGFSDHFDFLRYDPQGRFYQRRAFQDDIRGGNNAPKPMTELDFGLVVLRVAEPIAVGLAFGKAMGCDPQNTDLEFAFSWNGLKGRKLSSWANPTRLIWEDSPAVQNEVESYISVPLDTPLSILGGIVHKVTEPLFNIFGGFSLNLEIVEDLTDRLINRKL